jgi:hypothetical protein
MSDLEQKVADLEKAIKVIHDALQEHGQDFDTLALDTEDRDLKAFAKGSEGHITGLLDGLRDIFPKL